MYDVRVVGLGGVSVFDGTGTGLDVVRTLVTLVGSISAVVGGACNRVTACHVSSVPKEVNV